MSAEAKKIVLGRSLLNGMCKSCGCLNLDRKRAGQAPRLIIRRAQAIHNLEKIRDRCFNSKSRSFKDYGGRGITVCDEWADPDTGLDAFIKWAKTHGYSPELSIDRIDFNGNYMPANCRWADWFVQANNRRKPAFVKNQYGIWGYRNAV